VLAIDLETLKLTCTMKMNLVLLHKKNALVQEGSVYPRNGTPMGASISVLAHLVMKCTMQFILFLMVCYDAILPYPLMG